MAKRFTFPYPLTPKNLVVNEEIVVINNRAVNQLQLSWDYLQGVNHYKLAYRFIKESLPYPDKLPDASYTFVDVNGTTYNINGLGRGYINIFIYGVNKDNLFSINPLRTQVHTLGKVAPPENVSGFRIENQGTKVIKAIWTKATEADVLNGGAVEIRYTSATSGATWESAIELAKVNGNSTSTLLSSEPDGTFLAKFVDDGGRKSTTEATVSFTKPVNTYEQKSIGDFREDTYGDDWLGLSSTFLTADSASNVSLVNASDKSEGIKLTNASTKTGTYVFNQGLYFGATQDTPFTYFIERHIKMVGFYSTTAFSSRGNVQDVESFTGEKAPNVNVRFYYKTTLSTVSDKNNATWSDWQEFENTSIRGTGFTFKVVIETTDPAQNVKITELGVNASLPFRFMSPVEFTYPTAINGTPVGTSGIGVSFAFPFWTASGFPSLDPNVQITIMDLLKDEWFVLSNVGGSGFNLAILKEGVDGNGNTITVAVGAARTVMFSASGHGYMA